MEFPAVRRGVKLNKTKLDLRVRHVPEADGAHGFSDLRGYERVCHVQAFVAHPVLLRWDRPREPAPVVVPSVQTV
jgi:hypothetical protein